MVKKKRETNNLTLKAAVGAVASVILSVAILIFTNALFPFSRADRSFEIMQNYFLLNSTLAFAALCLSIYLMFIYLKDYLKLKSKFTLGILLAIFSFMLFAITSTPLLHMLFGMYGRMGLSSLTPLLFATIALAVLAWTSSK